MKKTYSRIVSVVLSLVLILALLPITGAAGATVSGDDMRQSVVDRAFAIMDIDWTNATRTNWSDVEGERLTDYMNSGILPTTYFQYTRLNFPYKGVMVESNTTTFEGFMSVLTDEKAPVPGIKHYTAAKGTMIGMDQNTFLTDITSRVMKQPLAGVREAMTSDELVALYEGTANLGAISSKASIGADALKAGYAKLQKGDLLLSWNDAAKVALTGTETDADAATLEPTVHVLVVKDVDPAAGNVTVMYNMYSKLLYRFKCDTCGVIETEGPTSTVCPVHTTSGTPKTHAETNPDAGCTGTWTQMYATNWAEETVSYDVLANGKVPYASGGYLPYTMKAYETGLPQADIKFDSEANAENASGGIRGTLSSDYRITAVKAVLTNLDTGDVSEFYDYPELGTYSYEYSNDALNVAIQTSEMGTNWNVVLYARTGPLNAEAQAAGEFVPYWEASFKKLPSSLHIAVDAGLTKVAQGEAFDVHVISDEADVTSAAATLTFADSLYTPDPEATKAKNPGAVVTVDEKTMTVTADKLNAGMGDTLFTMVFRATRTGDYPYAKEETGSVRFLEAKLGFNGEQMYLVNADPTPVMLDAGYNVEICEDYLGDYDLVLVYMQTYEMMKTKQETKLNVTYDGNKMYEITDSKYRADNVAGQGFSRIYGWICHDATATKVSHDADTQRTETEYTYDINQSGTFDMNDVQMVYNVVNYAASPEDSMVSCLLADINRDKKVTSDDVLALMAELTK